MKHFIAALAFLFSAISASGQTDNGQNSAQIFASLKGRSIIGSLSAPSFPVQESGTVVVTVWVDKHGRIMESLAGADGTTINDTGLWNAARDAAMKAHFNQKDDAPLLQQGTITYIFNPKPTVEYERKEVSDNTETPSILPHIQSTFFGMTIMKEYALEEIKHNVGGNGTFQSSTKEGNYNVISFRDLYFGGRRWNRGSFITAENGGLIFFYVLDMIPDGIIHEAEQNEAGRLFEELRETFDDKYGEGEAENSGYDEMSVTYLGSNGIEAILSKSRKSIGIIYAESSVLKEIKEAAKSEY